MRTILVLILMSVSGPVLAKCHHHCDHDYRVEQRLYTYQREPDGGYRYWESGARDFGFGDSFYGENGGTTYYGN